MNVSKTTINFAARRNIELIVDENSITFHQLEDECGEPALIYSIEDDGVFFKANIWLSASTKEELPHWIKDEQNLRQVIEFISSEFN